MNLMDTYDILGSRSDSNVYLQMPFHQIELFVKQAARREWDVTIQMNPSLFSKAISEVSGKISLSSRSSHVILTDESKQTVHLIQPHLIRHLRLSNDT